MSSTLQKLTHVFTEKLRLMRLFRYRDKAESARGSLSPKFGQVSGLVVLFELFGSTINPCVAFGKQPIDDTGQDNVPLP